MFFPFYALDVDHHHGLLVREAILGEDVGEYSVHFECPPRCRGRWQLVLVRGIRL